MNKNFLLLVLCLVIPLAGCGKKMPKATKETCSNEYLEKHPDIKKRLKESVAALWTGRGQLPSDVKAYTNGCDKLQQQHEQAEKNLKELQKYSVNASQETCSADYIKAHPYLVTKLGKLSVNDETGLELFWSGCESILPLVKEFPAPSQETCSDSYTIAHPEVLSSLWLFEHNYLDYPPNPKSLKPFVDGCQALQKSGAFKN
ncbi:MAG: entry exclusion lipoprotein TrbK [Acetobacter sp.]|nr:entry exclusion lipoprotein TrbK [Acetobacter sp.]